jgi:DNA modification methylase
MYQVITDSQYKGKDFFNFGSTSQLPRHRWYYLKEGFSASLVSEAIKQQLDGKNQQLRILEPFCGTGTTPLTAALTQHRCTALEVNPFLAFTAKVKTLAGAYNPKSYEEALEKIIKTSANGMYSHLENFSTFTQSESLDKWLFNKSVIRQFTSVMAMIKEYGMEFASAFELAAIVAAYQCCNARRDGKALRYKPDWKELNYSSEDFIRAFRSHATIILQDINNYPIKQEYQPEIKKGDVRKILLEESNDTYDLVITSPPYLNSFDYSDIYRPELFLGNYVKNNAELKQIRLQTIRSHVQVNWPEQIAFESVLLNPAIEQLSQQQNLWNKRIPLMVRAYFDDMYNVFNALKPKMHSGGQVWFVVSTSAFGGVHIPVDLIIADAANQAGFMLKGIHSLRNLRAAGQQWKHLDSKSNPLRESLIIMTA